MKSKIFLTLCLPLFLAVGCGDSEKNDNKSKPSRVEDYFGNFQGIEGYQSIYDEKGKEQRTLALCKTLSKSYLERLKNKPSDKHTYDECMRLLEKYKDSEPSAK